jgi:hypothetical protein
MNQDLYAPSQFSMPIVQIMLKYPDENLQQIEGSYDQIRHNARRIRGITSITFKSNFRAFGPYGKLGEDTFKSEIGKIVGFWGSANKRINSIGVFTVNPT